MSETTPRRILHLVIDGFPAEKVAQLVESAPASASPTEILTLTKTNAREALDLIFASDTIAVWSSISV